MAFFLCKFKLINKERASEIVEYEQNDTISSPNKDNKNKQDG
jgi:hypothetical protein